MQNPETNEHALVTLDANTGAVTVNDTITHTESKVDTALYAELKARAAALPQMKASLSIVEKYFSFTKPGDTVRGIYMGVKTIYKNQNKYQTISDVPPAERSQYKTVGDKLCKAIECARFIDQNGDSYLCGSIAFQDAVTSLLSVGDAFEATLTALKQTSSGGNVKIFDIRLLEPAPETIDAIVSDEDIS